MKELGSKKATPGSGSAAALLGMLSAKLMQSVIDKTLERKTRPEVNKKLLFIRDKIVVPAYKKLSDLVQQDAEIFQKVVDARIARDNSESQSDKARFSRVALKEQKRATECVVRISSISQKLLENGPEVYSLGYKAIAGEAGAALSAAAASVLSCQFVTLLNLRSFQKSKWKQNQINARDKSFEVFQQQYEKIISKLLEYAGEVSSNAEEQMKLDLGQ
jgi:formiminotetrahydrofolate cyclodeaminase